MLLVLLQLSGKENLTAGPLLVLLLVKSEI